MPQISVIIPTYNRARYVTKAINSILAQESRDFEIIVVDDGSQDDTRRALDSYMGRIRYFYQDNAGVSAARNAGIRNAMGAWIAFLDSDDEWRRGYLDAQLGSIRQFPQAVAHITNSIAVTAQNELQTDHFKYVGFSSRLGKKKQLFLARPFRTIVSHQHWYVQPIIMRRDALLESGLFNPSLSIAEDMDVLARLALKGPFTFSSEILVEICRRDEEISNLSSQYMNRGIYSRKAFADVFSALMPMPELTLPEKIALAGALAKRWRALGSVYMETGDPERARLYYGKSMLLYPSLKPLVRFLGSFLPRATAGLLWRKTDILPGDEGDVAERELSAAGKK